MLYTISFVTGSIRFFAFRRFMNGKEIFTLEEEMKTNFHLSELGLIIQEYATSSHFITSVSVEIRPVN